MSTVGKHSRHAGGTMTYFAHLTSSGLMPTTVKALIDRYNIRIYDETVESVPPSECAATFDEKPPPVNVSANNNDDDNVEPALPSGAGGTAETTPPTKVFRLKIPSLTRRLSKLGKRSSIDKSKTAAESGTSPSDSQLETASSSGTSMTTVDEPHLQTSTPLAAEQKWKDQDELKDKYRNESAAVGRCKSSVEDVPLRAKPAINFQDAVFYYPAEQTDDDDEVQRGLAHVVSEGRVPLHATAYRGSDDQLLLKEALSVQPAVGDDMPLIGGGSRRRPSVLRRMRAFFGRSSGGGADAGAHDDLVQAGRQLSAADATGSGWTELDDGAGAVVGGPAVDDRAIARAARSDTSPPLRYFDSGESTVETPTNDGAQLGTDNHAGSVTSVEEAAAGGHPTP